MCLLAALATKRVKKKIRYEYCRLSHNRVRCFLNAVLTASGSKYSNIKQRARVGKGSRGRRVAVRTFAQRLWPETARPLMNANSFCFSKKKKVQTVDPFKDNVSGITCKSYARKSNANVSRKSTNTKHDVRDLLTIRQCQRPRRKEYCPVGSLSTFFL